MLSLPKHRNALKVNFYKSFDRHRMTFHIYDIASLLFNTGEFIDKPIYFTKPSNFQNISPDFLTIVALNAITSLQYQFLHYNWRLQFLFSHLFPFGLKWYFGCGYLLWFALHFVRSIFPTNQHF